MPRRPAFFFDFLPKAATPRRTPPPPPTGKRTPGTTSTGPNALRRRQRHILSQRSWLGFCDEDDAEAEADGRTRGRPQFLPTSLGDSDSFQVNSCGTTIAMVNDKWGKGRNLSKSLHPTSTGTQRVDLFQRKPGAVTVTVTRMGHPNSHNEHHHTTEAKPG
jgi:hypothetical protein